MEPKLEQPKTTEKQIRLARLQGQLKTAESFHLRDKAEQIRAEIRRVEEEGTGEERDEEIFQIGLERLYNEADRLGEGSEFGRGRFKEHFELCDKKEKFPQFIVLLETKFGRKVFVPPDLAHQSKPEFGIGGDVHKEIPSGQLIFVGDSGIVLKIVNEPERKEKGLVVSRETVGIEVCKIPPEFVSKLKSLAK